jgi:glycosyltransferase involved in cell wall biosynthesis
MKTISIDARMIHMSGIGTYISQLLPLIINQLSHIQFLLLGNEEELRRYNWTAGNNVSTVDFRVPIYSISEQTELLKKIPKLTDMFWSPHYNIPVFYSGKLLVTVHDVFHLAMPEFVQGIHRKIYAKMIFKYLKHKSSAIIFDSDFTNSQFRKFVGNVTRKAQTIHIGVDDSWFRMNKKTSPYARSYILFVGNVKPHKNVKGLLSAYATIKDKYDVDLLIIGKKEGFITGDQSVFQLAEQMEGRVQFTGYVDDDTLKQYFAHADMLVFPSLYEGFGLPPLEAMASGCPVIVSNAASLPEVCGDAALYCDPYQPDDIANKIALVMGSSSLREQLQVKGYERAKQFTWEKCAQETVAVIEEVLSK